MRTSLRQCLAVTATYLKHEQSNRKCVLQRLTSWTVVTRVLYISPLTHKNHTQNKAQLLLIFLGGPLFLSSLQKTITLTTRNLQSGYTELLGHLGRSIRDFMDFLLLRKFKFIGLQKTVKRTKETASPMGTGWKLRLLTSWWGSFPRNPNHGMLQSSYVLRVPKCQLINHRISQCSSRSHLEAQTCCIKWPLLGERSCRHSRDHSILGPEGPGGPLIFNEPCSRSDTGTSTAEAQAAFWFNSTFPQTTSGRVRVSHPSLSPRYSYQNLFDNATVGALLFTVI